MKSGLRFTLVAFFIILFAESSISAPLTNPNTVQRMVASEIEQIAQHAVAAKSEEVFDRGLRDLANEVARLGYSSSAEQALDQIVEQVDGEQWSLTSSYRFGLFESLIRSQGLASDGKNHFWYSGTQSLLRATSKTGSCSVLKLFPLPKNLVSLGDDHVGDIDYADGLIYAPAEDGKNNYKNPYVVLYDAKNLTVKTSFRLPVAPQNEGVPWVAVDPIHERAYSALYYNVNSINVYDLKTFAPLGEIALSKTIHNWQGAKVVDGFMYATSDGDPVKFGKHIYKINLATGTVIEVATLPSDVTELEGLAFSTNAQGVEMDVLGVVRHGTGKVARTLSTRSQLHMYSRTALSLRDQVRDQIRSSKK
jgi:hypothetical protein